MHRVNRRFTPRKKLNFFAVLAQIVPFDSDQTGSGAAFMRSILKRLLTLRRGTAAINLR